MKARDLRDRSTEDLAELEKSLLAESFQNKFKNFTNRLDDTSMIRKSKRDLARVKLILSERAAGITVTYKATTGEAKKPKTRAPKAAAADHDHDHDHDHGEGEAAEKPKKKAAAKTTAKAAPAKKEKAAKSHKSETKAAPAKKAKSEKGSK